MPWGEIREGNGKPPLSAFHVIKLCEDRQKWLAPILYLFGKFTGKV